MPAFHITGPNGSGKSTVGRVLAARGFKVIESDSEPGFSSWVHTENGEKVTYLPAQPVPKKWLTAHAWRWDTEKVHEILKTVRDEPVFIVGGASNEKEVYHLFRKRFGFFIDDGTLVRRLRIREPERWIEGSAELESSLAWNKRSAEFNLSHGAVPVDGSRDPEINADTIVSYVNDTS